ncbi:long-chain fatty acid transporter [Alteromonas pelagimontana]|uniref:Long-chain fatty acid transporter n=1 Tax=Alteromonas pelagimontana TaxID=1858656 RepID=A0A6M4MCG2_9ALTE|nr:porin [Alteromonas pelagimontana]QJR80727.1 long-chain fatty acid transporter [Alteromonas pelagimontana]
MNKIKFLPACLCLTLSTAVSHQAMAAGFQVNEHSANGLGRAFAGQAAMPENASVLATNPAAITVFDAPSFSAGINYIDPNVDIDGELVSTLGGTSIPMSANENDIADSAVIPSFFYAQPINEKVSVGLGIFSSYGLSTDYSDDFNALHFADNAEITTITMNPTVAYKVTDTISLGLGLSVTYADAEIGTSTPKAVAALTQGAIPANATIVNLQGDDLGYGWNVGAFWQATSTTNVALSYRAETELNLSGEINSDLEPTYNQGGKLALNLASITELAVNQIINDQWSVQASVNFTDWSTFDKLEANLADGTDLLLKQEDFEDTWRASIGATYQYNDQITLRAGYAYDDGAVSYAHRSLSIPDTDRQWFTVGATYAVTASTSVDFGYAYLKGREANVNQQRGLGPIVSNLTATENASANILSVQVNTQF